MAYYKQRVLSKEDGYLRWNFVWSTVLLSLFMRQICMNQYKPSNILLAVLLIIYFLSHILNGKRVNVWAWFHVCNCVCNLQMRQNGSLHVAIYVNANGWILNFMTQAGFPKESRSEGGRVSKNAWILQCHIRIYCIYGIWA